MARPLLVRALEDDWRETIDEVARSRSWPTSRDVARLGARVAELSKAYNDPARARAPMSDAGPARLGFSFPRDVPKGAAAARELVATGALRLDPGRPLRVLDLGAGLGATTWGVARALEASGARGAVEATWLDADAQALDLGAAVVRARQATERPVELVVRTRVGPLVMAGALGRFDVVLVGQTLSELDVALTDDERCARHADLLRTWVEDRLEPGGAVVVVEPALRDRTRHLHRVRDAVLAGSRGSGRSAEDAVTVFAPCLHAAPCPALARETDWCHEDLAVDLPPWLVPVARAAGLRHEGLTFSYLVLRRGGPRLVDSLSAPAGAGRLRVVSDAMRSKGKREAFVCGELMAASAAPGEVEAGAASEAGEAPSLVAARVRLMRLDRDEAPGNAAWERLHRGDLLVVAPAPELERPRIGSATTVTRESR
jgi:predicted O-methyltransferase YrrM